LFVFERGTLGEFNLGQAMVCRTMPPLLDALAVENHTVTHWAELAGAGLDIIPVQCESYRFQSRRSVCEDRRPSPEFYIGRSTTGGG
jgi:hypothetical protein